MAIGIAGVGFRDVSVLSKSYANIYVSYAAHFGESSLIWQAESGTYEIKWGSIVRGVERSGVTVLGLDDSRAICVLPDELLTPAARDRIERELSKHGVPISKGAPGDRDGRDGER